MKNHVVLSTVFFLGILSTNIYAYREPPKQPPLAVYGNGQVELSPDFMDYLIEVKDFGHYDNIFKTVRYDFPEIQQCARDFIRDGGAEKTRRVREKKDEEYRKERVLAEEKREQEENNYILGVTGRDFLNLFDRMAEDSFSEKGEAQNKFLNLLATKLLKDGEIYKMKENYRTFCYDSGFFQTSRERLISVVKKQLKKDKLLNNEEFLSGSAALVVQQILIREFPCKKK